MAMDKNKVEEEAIINRFYKIVLSWDYFRLLKESEKVKSNSADWSSLGLNEVKNTYKDAEDYINTFEPLLFEEVKAQIIQRKDEEEATEWVLGIIAECGEVNGFCQPLVMYDSNESIAQNDLLLLSKEKFGENKKLPTAYAFALVEHRQQDKIRLRMNLSGEYKGLNTDDVESCQRLLNMHPLVTDVKGYIHFKKVSSLSTIVREYVALRSVSSLPFRDLILTATDNNDDAEDRAWKISRPLKEFIESNHNASQIEAINAGLSRRKFVLIQGPPGTGKTQTILGLLSAVLHATPARIHSDREKLGGVKRRPELTPQEKYYHWLKACPWLTGINPRDRLMPMDGDNGFFPTTGNELVCFSFPFGTVGLGIHCLTQVLYRNQRWLIPIGSIVFVFWYVLRQILPLMRLFLEFIILAFVMKMTVATIRK
ncbi:OLC1v1002530C1 [Oldenlandia corymbosa var. corymbosa]|uniref:OLC1v1002530C1 n=1 Tax=Oldenlandia corymbosa var. corymbosa TaxID=529605 RepID=A0AAV1D7V7_OLDCO|nr:OLC1v1002530C1 [Oldenlandia corymbosa var. corymbosa]